MTQRPWVRRRAPGAAIDWEFVAYWVLVGLFILFSAKWVLDVVGYYLDHPTDLFVDAGLYYRATEAWLTGGNPWTVTRSHGVPFAGPPTTLLLNVPLQPFGPSVATLFWPVAGLVGWVVAMRRLDLPPWWILFPPFVEALLAGSPDPALVGLTVIGGGAIAAVTKPYAVPAILASGGLRAVLFAGVAVVVTAPLLPWGQFVSELDRVRAAFATWSSNSSAWGDPLLMVATALGLVALGPRLGLLMATPGMWPGAQLHYSVFSVQAGVISAFLALTLAIPDAAPYGIIAFAVFVRGRDLIVRRWAAPALARTWTEP